MTTQDGDHPTAVHGTWTETARDGWTYNRDPDPRDPRPQSFPEDPRANVALAKLTAEWGYLNLSQAHALAAQDCPRWCGCGGCTSTRAEATEQRAAKAKRAALARRVEA